MVLELGEGRGRDARISAGVISATLSSFRSSGERQSNLSSLSSK